MQKLPNQLSSQKQIGVRSQWHLLKPETIVIPGSTRDPVEADTRQLLGSRVEPIRRTAGVTNLLVLLGISA